jgi:hypothetical protein
MAFLLATVTCLQAYANQTSLLVDSSSAANAESPRESDGYITPIRLDAIDDDMVIDGIIDESVWMRAPVYKDFKITVPDSIDSPPYESLLRVFYTDRGLYVSYDMEQPRETIVKRRTIRDVYDVTRDSIAISLDPSGEGKYGYWMSLALGGDQSDGTIRPEREYDFEWNGAWYGATSETERGWSVEMFIPWSQMAMPKNDSARQLGFHARRNVAHLAQTWSWPALPRSQPMFISRFKKLELTGVAPRRQWSVFPFVAVTLNRTTDDVRQKVGVDVLWRPATNLQLSMTVNPDFGTAEADAVNVNFTADEVLFPETRLFFVEGQEVFNTSPRADLSKPLPFFIINTRRIGGRSNVSELPDDTELSKQQQLRFTDLLGAAKVTGEFGRIGFGSMIAIEDTTEIEAGDSRFRLKGREFGVARAIYSLGNGASTNRIGVISSVVQDDDSVAAVYGMDYHHLSEEGVIKFDAQLVTSDLDDKGTGLGGFFDLEYSPKKGLKHLIAITAFDDKLDVNDFGYQRRGNMRQARYQMTWTSYDVDNFRSVEFSPQLLYEMNGEDLVTRRDIELEAALEFTDLSKLSMSAEYIGRHYDDRGSFGNGSHLLPGQPSITAIFRTDNTERLHAYLGVSGKGEPLGGRANVGEAGITWTPVYNFSVNFAMSFRRSNGQLLHLQDQQFGVFNFKRNKPRFEASYFPAPDHSIRLAFEWVGIKATQRDAYRISSPGGPLIKQDGSADPPVNFSVSQLSFQLRYRWELAPLSDLVVVYAKLDDRQSGLAGFDDLLRTSWRDPLEDRLVVRFCWRFGS